MDSPLERKLVPCPYRVVSEGDGICYHVGVCPNMECTGDESATGPEPLEDYAERLRELLDVTFRVKSVWCSDKIDCGNGTTGIDCGSPECISLRLQAAAEWIAEREAERAVEAESLAIEAQKNPET